MEITTNHSIQYKIPTSYAGSGENDSEVLRNIINMNITNLNFFINSIDGKKNKLYENTKSLIDKIKEYEKMIENSISQEKRFFEDIKINLEQRIQNRDPTLITIEEDMLFKIINENGNSSKFYEITKKIDEEIRKFEIIKNCVLKDLFVKSDIQPNESSLYQDNEVAIPQIDKNKNIQRLTNRKRKRSSDGESTNNPEENDADFKIPHLDKEIKTIENYENKNRANFFSNSQHLLGENKNMSNNRRKVNNKVDKNSSLKSDELSSDGIKNSLSINTNRKNNSDVEKNDKKGNSRKKGKGLKNEGMKLQLGNDLSNKNDSFQQKCLLDNQANEDISIECKNKIDSENDQTEGNFNLYENDKEKEKIQNEIDNKLKCINKKNSDKISKNQNINKSAKKAKAETVEVPNLIKNISSPKNNQRTKSPIKDKNDFKEHTQDNVIHKENNRNKERGKNKLQAKENKNGKEKLEDPMANTKSAYDEDMKFIFSSESEIEADEESFKPEEEVKPKKNQINKKIPKSIKKKNKSVKSKKTEKQPLKNNLLINSNYNNDKNGMKFSSGRSLNIDEDEDELNTNKIILDKNENLTNVILKLTDNLTDLSELIGKESNKINEYLMSNLENCLFIKRLYYSEYIIVNKEKKYNYEYLAKDNNLIEKMENFENVRLVIIRKGEKLNINIILLKKIESFFKNYIERKEGEDSLIIKGVLNCSFDNLQNYFNSEIKSFESGIIIQIEIYLYKWDLFSDFNDNSDKTNMNKQEIDEMINDGKILQNSRILTKKRNILSPAKGNNGKAK